MNTDRKSVRTPIENPTYGQKAVGINFNPSGDSIVDRIKIHCANIIDCMNENRNLPISTPEQKRLYSIAITEIQAAQMWAVKAFNLERLN